VRAIVSSRITAILDFALRFAFFVTAPFVLVLVAALFPITGALVQVGLSLVVFFTAEAARGLASKWRIARLVLGKFLALDDYYRAHPPKPFVYYVFYPVLFPYWLFVPAARREFLLFKGYTIFSFLLFLGMLGAQFYIGFPPELSLRDFLPIAAATFVIETAVVLMFLLPMVTTVVHFHTKNAHARLAVLLAFAIAAVVCAILLLHRPRDPVVSFATRSRVRMRTNAAVARSRAVQTVALQEAWKALPLEKDDVDRDGKVEGLPLERARQALAKFYKADEAYAFDLWMSRKPKGGSVMVVYFEARGKNGPIWLAMDDKRVATHDPKRLPKGAFAAMKSAADALE
jgi:hypothetical protein